MVKITRAKTVTTYSGGTATGKRVLLESLFGSLSCLCVTPQVKHEEEIEEEYEIPDPAPAKSAQSATKGGKPTKAAAVVVVS